MSQPPSRTSTHGFLFADLRDYSRYVETHGDVTAAALLTEYRRMVREVVGRHDGAEIRTEGDSFYVVFPSASSAVRCGMDILEAAAADRPDGPIRVGVGVHAGETAETEEGFVGSAVNIAARVCSQAAAGELLVTETVRFLTRTLVPYSYVPRGTRRLKGISEAISLYRVVAPTAALRSGIVRRRLYRRPPPGIVVVAVIAIAAILVVPPVLFLGAGRSTPSPGGSSALTLVSASPTPGSVPTDDAALTEAESDLAARIPSSVRGSCTRSPEGVRANGSVVSLTCPLGDADAEIVTYNMFDSPALQAATYDAYVTREHLPQGDCMTSARGSGTWALGETIKGRVLCFQEESGGRSWIVWTYEQGQGEGILAAATRHDLNWRPLADWWRDVAPYVIH